MVSLFSEVRQGKKFEYMDHTFIKVDTKRARAVDTFNGMTFYIAEKVKVKIKY